MIARCRRCDRGWERTRRPASSVVTLWERGTILRYRGWCWPRWEKDGTTHRAWNHTLIYRSNSCGLACLSCGAMITHSDGRLPSASRAAVSRFCHGFRLAASAAQIPAGFRLRSDRSPYCTFALRCWSLIIYFWTNNVEKRKIKYPTFFQSLLFVYFNPVCSMDFRKEKYLYLLFLFRKVNWYSNNLL